MRAEMGEQQEAKAARQIDMGGGGAAKKKQAFSDPGHRGDQWREGRSNEERAAEQVLHPQLWRI